MERAIGSVRVTVFGRLAELSLSSCCPRLRLRAVRRLALHTLDHLEVLDINGVDDLEALDVSAPKPPVPEPERPLLLPPSPRRLPGASHPSAPAWRVFAGSTGHSSSRSIDAPYTMQLLQACSLAVGHLAMELVMPNQLRLTAAATLSPASART
uniref:Uncharacterized protein n=1 Tax=Oryza rufipogon TaxID=4529 RepID=A0A0E0RJS5_ORYRU